MMTLGAVLVAFAIGTGPVALGPLEAQQAREEERQEREEHKAAREEDRYERGTDALDEASWDEAIQAFDDVIEAKGRRADGALYWKAYAQSKLGRRDEALKLLAVTVHDWSAVGCPFASTHGIALNM